MALLVDSEEYEAEGVRVTQREMEQLEDLLRCDHGLLHATRHLQYVLYKNRESLHWMKERQRPLQAVNPSS